MWRITFAFRHIDVKIHPIYNICILYSQETTFLEACLENHTKSNLFMDQVEFEPAQHWTATLLKADGHHSENSGLTRCCDKLIAKLLLIEQSYFQWFIFATHFPYFLVWQRDIQAAHSCEIWRRNSHLSLSVEIVIAWICANEGRG